MRDVKRDEAAAPAVVDRSTFETAIDALRIREKAHTREGDAIAAARRRLPMVEVDAAIPLGGERAPTLLDAFEGRQLLVAYYFMWHPGHAAAQQCEGCTYFTSQVRELSHLHFRDVTYATFCQGPYEESIRYRDFMGWKMPWYAPLPESLAQLLLDLTVHGRQEDWEDSPRGWPRWRKGKDHMRADGRPMSQWARLKAGHSDDLGTRRR